MVVFLNLCFISCINLAAGIFNFCYCVFLVVDKSACKALDDLSTLLKCLRVWLVEEPITIDVLMPPSECYYTDLFFQVSAIALHLWIFFKKNYCC